MMYSSNLGDRDDSSLSWGLDFSRERGISFQRGVRAAFMIVIEVGGQDALPMPFP
jgi:hypothetical protein